MGMEVILTDIVKYLEGDKSHELITELAFFSSLAGVAISNSRTGNIHEAAGALLENVELSHGETLLVFARAALQQYDDLTFDFLNAVAINSNFQSFDDVMCFWYKAFEESGSLSRIDKELKNIVNQDEVKNQILARLIADKVWNEKEAPSTTTPQSLISLASAFQNDFRV
jgi:alcohol dehydrogenase class IV